jgi:hypothetical protein
MTEAFGALAGASAAAHEQAPHYTWAKDGDVIIQVTGVGPSGKTFVEQPK